MRVDEERNGSEDALGELGALDDERVEERSAVGHVWVLDDEEAVVQEPVCEVEGLKESV